MWRAFPYHLIEFGGENPNWTGFDYKFKVDQLQKVMSQLKNNPDDRRIIISAWHPYWVDHCALPPCHCFMQFHTEELTLEERYEIFEKGWDAKKAKAEWNAQGFEEHNALDAHCIPRRRLNCLLLIRSNDIFLGKPFNISSYALLTAMIAHCVNMESGVLTYTMGDAHIYENHLEQVKLQLSREPMKLPKLWLNPRVKLLFDFKYDDIKLIDYVSHPAIKGEIAV
jgi:thymidylate synthase